jgi:hypothetical protein
MVAMVAPLRGISARLRGLSDLSLEPFVPRAIMDISAPAISLADSRPRKHPAEILAQGPSCIFSTPQLKREWSPWPEFGLIPRKLYNLSKR